MYSRLLTPSPWRDYFPSGSITSSFSYGSPPSKSYTRQCLSAFFQLHFHRPFICTAHQQQRNTATKHFAFCPHRSHQLLHCVRGFGQYARMMRVRRWDSSLRLFRGFRPRMLRAQQRANQDPKRPLVNASSVSPRWQCRCHIALRTTRAAKSRPAKQPTICITNI